MRIFITGGSGFAGSALVRHLITESDHHVLNFDKETYAASRAALAAVESNSRYDFVHGDICDASALRIALANFQPQAIFHLAAETHVDRSIEAPTEFIRTNITGTFSLLTEANSFWQGLRAGDRAKFHFHHVSTDEVFGSVDDGIRTTEESRYNPSSPYSASKASADHLVAAWAHTFGLPASISNACNLFGPWQYPEKLIPKTIDRALHGKPLPIYGNGLQSREWLFVEDHARALRAIIESPPGRRFNIGSGYQLDNLTLVRTICRELDRLNPSADGRSYCDQILFAKDRPGHDRRYALDATRIRTDLGWEPKTEFAAGLATTIAWHLAAGPQR